MRPAMDTNQSAYDIAWCLARGKVYISGKVVFSRVRDMLTGLFSINVT
jgi:hypothetical protein